MLTYGHQRSFEILELNNQPLNNNDGKIDDAESGVGSGQFMDEFVGTNIEDILGADFQGFEALTNGQSYNIGTENRGYAVDEGFSSNNSTLPAGMEAALGTDIGNYSAINTDAFQQTVNQDTLDLYSTLGPFQSEPLFTNVQQSVQSTHSAHSEHAPLSAQPEQMARPTHPAPLNPAALNPMHSEYSEYSEYSTQSTHSACSTRSPHSAPSAPSAHSAHSSPAGGQPPNFQHAPRSNGPNVKKVAPVYPTSRELVGESWYVDPANPQEIVFQAVLTNNRRQPHPSGDPLALESEGLRPPPAKGSGPPPKGNMQEARPPSYVQGHNTGSFFQMNMRKKNAWKRSTGVPRTKGVSKQKVDGKRTGKAAYESD